MNKITDYQSALDYIYRFVDNSRTHQQNLSPENFNLARVEKLCDLIGNPQDQYSTVHVAGSKGKGSVCSMIASVLNVAGYRVGLHTSPHLEEFTERIQIGGKPVDEETLVEAMQYLQPYIEQTDDITTFEVITVLGFYIFAQMKVDIAVIEVGLGGRLDATNVIRPLVSVISSLSLEHTFVLGNTIGEIAGEKGGIIKDGVPVISSPQPVEARRVLDKIASDRNTQVLFVDDIITERDAEIRNWQQIFRIDGNIAGRAVDEQLRIRLLGPHQRINAIVAYAALKTLQTRGIKFSDQAIQSGFDQMKWPARFEILDNHIPLVIDAAHNEDSMARLSQTIGQVFPGKKVILIFGVSADKDVSGMINALVGKLSVVICVASQHPRAMAPDELAGYFRDYDIETLTAHSIAEAYEQGKSFLTPNHVLIGAGSLFVVGEIRTLWKNLSEIGN